MRLHIDSGGVLVTGTTGANPNLGAGNRMMYVPAQVAFRCGSVTGTDWDSGNVGYGSFAIGTNTRASGDVSICMGATSIASGSGSISIGLANNVSGLSAVGIGCAVAPSAQHSMAIGTGVSIGSPLTNSIPSTLAIAMNHTNPTIFVVPPDLSQTEGSVGFGNVTAPTELIDANGNARFRVIPEGPGDVLITGKLEDVDGDYSLRYLEFSDDDSQVLAGNGTWVDINSSACEWNEVTNGPSDDLVMGYTGACNQGRVGIGTSVPTSKLHINNDLGTNSGMTVRVASNGSNNTGVVHWGIACRTTGGGASQVGIIGQANATASFTGATRPLIGVVGSAVQSPTPTPVLCGHQAVGVYGEVINANQSCGSGVAGYFNSNIVVAGATINYSDETVKTDLTPITGALEQILQLEPMSYYLNNDAVGGTAFSSDLAFGLSAQHTQQILPSIVKEVPKPFIRDEEDNLISQEGELLGISYVELIPILISAMQEQQAQIEALSAQVAACCAVDAGNRSGALPANDIIIEQSANRLDQNNPNPFNSNTRIGFNLAEDCRARVCIYNSAGQLIDCLIDEFRSSGAHSIEWNTSNTV